VKICDANHKIAECVNRDLHFLRESKLSDSYSIESGRYLGDVEDVEASTMKVSEIDETS
jgi:hypothetical protein